MTSSGRGISDGVLVAALGSLLGVALGIWLWGGIAGAAFGRGWPHVNGGELAGILVRLPAQLSHPARAWPLATRSRLPGPVGFYAALALLVASLCTGVWLLAVAGFLLPRRRSVGATWARSWELRPLLRAPLPRVRPESVGVSAAAHGRRLTLGRRRGRLLRAEHRHALVAFGPPQSGKSAGLAVPALLEWEGPAVASSIKTDLLAATARRRRGLGAVFIFDPFVGWSSRPRVVASAPSADLGWRPRGSLAARRGG
jgi:type IV secretion system protein VirD4